MREHKLLCVAIGSVVLMCGCTAHRQYEPGEIAPRAGDEIMVCGQLVHSGAPVVLWIDPGGYDAYRVHRRFDPDQQLPSAPAGRPTPQRYGTWRRHISDDVRRQVVRKGWSLSQLRDWVDLFVVHYDVCGTSRRCFTVLQDVRGLSVHFMLDLDGTIYQTLDLKERAWHAGSANDRSVGIEIANIGAYPDMTVLNKWYTRDETGRTVVTLPASMGDGGLRTRGFVARPSRNDPVRGVIQGQDLIQYDLTDAQYESLIKLTATLCRVFPKIKPDYPRDERGQLIRHVLSPEQFQAFSGILGHYHITKRKTDPGPAFDWDRLIRGVRDELGDVPDTPSGALVRW